MKTCKKCEVEKPLDEFHKNSGLKDGHMGICKECNTSRGIQYYEENKDRQKELRYRRNFTRHGITLEIFNDKLLDQGGVCAICKESDVSFVVDHDHSCCSGQFGCEKCFRGVLCKGCNMAIGIFKDSTQSLKNAIAYLSQ